MSNWWKVSIGCLSNLASLDVIGPAVVFVALCVIIFLDYRQRQTCCRYNSATVPSALPRLTLEMLRQYNGKDLPLVYCSLRGRIYDVSTSTNFSPGGSYNFLAGADATLGMARMSYDKALLNSTSFTEVTQEEWQCVDGWVEYMDSKYKCVALLQEYVDFEQTKAACSESEHLD
mmetsp:Transcript_160245/g.282685  ORF Transcript_160245/g.282685 Transcript_160245/m.282685 type:complete len:174 (+) Transcript_160245:72-593(+)